MTMPSEQTTKPPSYLDATQQARSAALGKARTMLSVGFPARVESTYDLLVVAQWIIDGEWPWNDDDDPEPEPGTDALPHIFRGGPGGMISGASGGGGVNYRGRGA